jgi:hypothetical protein
MEQGLNVIRKWIRMREICESGGFSPDGKKLQRGEVVLSLGIKTP